MSQQHFPLSAIVSGQSSPTPCQPSTLAGPPHSLSSKAISPETAAGAALWRTLGMDTWFRFPEPSTNIKFWQKPSANGGRGKLLPGCRLKFREQEASEMRKAALTLATAATIGVSALVAPSPAQAWRGGWGGGWGPGLAAGLIGAAVIGGIASSAYAYGPGYGYYGGPGYGYYGGPYGYSGGYAPVYYGGYAPAYYGGYAPYYGGYGYRRVIRPAYAYGPRYYRGYRYGWR